MIERNSLFIAAGLLLSVAFVRTVNADVAAGTIAKIDEEGRTLAVKVNGQIYTGLLAEDVKIAAGSNAVGLKDLKVDQKVRVTYTRNGFKITVTDIVAETDELAIDRGIGLAVADFTLSDTAGKPVRLYGFAGKKGVVVVFIGTGCPVSNLYLPRLAELAQTYQPKGIEFVAIDSNRGAQADKVAQHAKEHGVSFPVLLDPGNVVADQVRAERTCEVLVVEGKQARLIYRGAIDDQYSPKAHKEKATRSYLADVLDALAAGRKVDVKATEVAGCPIERVELKDKPSGGSKTAAKVKKPVALRAEDQKPIAIGKVNYAADVAAIVQRKCQECHRPGQVGPFSLLTFKNARDNAASIREVVDQRRMPPWHADPQFGHFENDRSLSAVERATILAWIEQGAPEGDPRDAPAPTSFAEGWKIGKPDIVFEMPESYTVAAQGVLPYQYFRVPTGFTEDTWIQAAEARPGDRTVVHHCVVGVDDHKKGRKSIGVGEDSYLALFVPGESPSIYPPGTAKLVPAGSDLIFQMHYTPVGRAKSDRSSVALILAKGPVQHRVVTYGIANSKFEIPPGHGNYPAEASLAIPQDAQLLSLSPHMHLRGKSFQYSAVYPDGKDEVLLSVPAYDFAWQNTYRLTEAKPLPKGTRINCLAHYDNSPDNPANPDPTKAVRWGQQTFEEMLIGYVDYVVDVPGNTDAATK
jgi:peroxiredoxin/mono/diheme cytochrome c family protein